VVSAPVSRVPVGLVARADRDVVPVAPAARVVLGELGRAVTVVALEWGVRAVPVDQVAGEAADVVVGAAVVAASAASSMRVRF